MIRRHAIRRGPAAVAAVAAVALAAPAAAYAGSVSIGPGSVLQFSGGPAESNHVVLSYDWGSSRYLIGDTGTPSISLGGKKNPCSAVTAQEVACPFGSFLSIDVTVGDAGGYAEDRLALTPVTLTGGAGNDTLIGGGGATTLDGGGGSNTLTAGAGDTRLVGGSGTTTMTGGPGQDTFQGGPGVDIIRSRDARAEQVACGGGADVVTADASDTVAADCESVDRGLATQPAGGGASGGGNAGAGLGDSAAQGPAVVPVQSTTVDASGRVPVSVSCPADAAGGCEGVLTLSLAGGNAVARVVAARRQPGHMRLVGRSRRFRLAAGEKGVVTVQLDRRTARALKHGPGATRLSATVRLRTAAGENTSSSTITVKAARRRARVVRLTRRN